MRRDASAGTVVAIFNTMTKSTLLFFGKMDNLNHALNLHNINKANPELCMELRTFYRYRHTYFDEDTNTLGEVMENLTDHLRRQVRLSVPVAVGRGHRCEPPWHGRTGRTKRMEGSGGEVREGL
jgi:hypothetical protein